MGFTKRKKLGVTYYGESRQDFERAYQKGLSVDKERGEKGEEKEQEEAEASIKDLVGDDYIELDEAERRTPRKKKGR